MINLRLRMCICLSNALSPRALSTCRLAFASTLQSREHHRSLMRELVVCVYLHINDRVYNQRRANQSGSEMASIRRPWLVHRKLHTRRIDPTSTDGTDEISNELPRSPSSFEFGRSAGKPEMTPDPQLPVLLPHFVSINEPCVRHPRRVI